MGFTNLISRNPIGKPIAFSNDDKEFVIATISKISSIKNPTIIQLLHKSKRHSKLIGQILENPTDVIVHIKTNASILSLVSSRLKVCNFDLFRSEIYTSYCIPLDFSKIIFWKLPSQTFLFYNFYRYCRNSQISHGI